MCTTGGELFWMFIGTLIVTDFCVGKNFIWKSFMSLFKKRRGKSVFQIPHL
jgi:hypothetical protein